MLSLKIHPQNGAADVRDLPTSASTPLVSTMAWRVRVYVPHHVQESPMRVEIVDVAPKESSSDVGKIPHAQVTCTECGEVLALAPPLGWQTLPHVTPRASSVSEVDWEALTKT